MELNLGSNAITKIEGLDTLSKLRKLHLTSNKIKRLENLEVRRCRLTSA